MNGASEICIHHLQENVAIHFKEMLQITISEKFMIACFKMFQTNNLIKKLTKFQLNVH